MRSPSQQIVQVSTRQDDRSKDGQARARNCRVAAGASPASTDRGRVPPRRPLNLFRPARAIPACSVVTTVKRITEKRDEVRHLIVGLIKANCYIKANREPSVQSLMEIYKTDRDTAAANYEFLSKTINENGSPTENGLRLLIDDAKQTAKVTRDVSVNEVADFSIVREAQRELGIR